MKFLGFNDFVLVFDGIFWFRWNFWFSMELLIFYEIVLVFDNFFWFSMKFLGFNEIFGFQLKL